MVRENWFRLVAFAVLFGLLAGGFASSPILSNSFIGAGTIALFLSIYVGIQKWRSKDAYSLETLNEMIREGTYDPNDVPEVPENADGYCMCCGEVYNSRFRKCPKCRC